MNWKVYTLITHAGANRSSRRTAEHGGVLNKTQAKSNGKFLKCDNRTLSLHLYLQRHAEEYWYGRPASLYATHCSSLRDRRATHDFS
jgi:hypothetical protein